MRSVVVVPARDEERRIGRCLEALSVQTTGRDAFVVVVVLDVCRDATAAVARRAGQRLGLDVRLIPGPGTGTGGARRAGMDLACDLLLDAADERGLIASTDADSRVARDWLARQLAHVRRGARAIGGLIELDEEEAARLPADVLRWRREQAAIRLARVRRVDPDAGHHHFAGASLSLTAGTYRSIGGIEPCPALEDAALARRLAEHGVPVLRPRDVRVRTSARLEGRAAQGLAVDLARAHREATETAVSGARAAGAGRAAPTLAVETAARPRA